VDRPPIGEQPHAGGLRDILDSLIHGPHGEGSEDAGDASTPQHEVAGTRTGAGAAGRSARTPEPAIMRAGGRAEVRTGEAAGAASARGRGAERPNLPTGVVDPLTGFYNAGAWSAIVTSEEARWARYRRPCHAVQVEVFGIAAMADRLGDVAAGRLLDLLVLVLRDETRTSDLYARTTDWRIAGLLPELDRAGAARFEARLREAFNRQLGGDLAIRLRIGMGLPTTGGTIADALLVAERAMWANVPTAAPMGGVPGQPEPAPAELAPAPAQGAAGQGPTGPALIRDRLVELEQLLADGLISQAEHAQKRAEILARL
jgi:GGDEF domain-containing protein